MIRDCFSMLCQRIISKIGEKQLKSEVYSNAFLKGNDQMYDTNYKTSGGCISGEGKLEITLRLFTDNNALDLGVIFDIEPGYLTKLMNWVLLYWLIK